MRACKKAVERNLHNGKIDHLFFDSNLYYKKMEFRVLSVKSGWKTDSLCKRLQKKLGGRKTCKKMQKKIHNLGLQTFFKVSNYARKINHRNCDFPAINAHWWIFTSEHSRGSTPHPVWEPFAFSQIKKKQKIECDDLNWHYIQEILWLHHPKSKGQQAIWVCWVGCGRGRHQEPFFVLLFSLKKMQLDLLLKKIVK